MHLELIILEGSHAGRQIPLVHTPLTFGRSSAAGVSFPLDSFMSGMHLMVQHALSCVVLVDMHSSNGTFLNGQRIRQAIAVPGDILKIGTLTMKLAAGKVPPPEVAAIPEIAPVSETVPAPDVAPAPETATPPTREPVAETTVAPVFSGIPEVSVVSSRADFGAVSITEQNLFIFEALRQTGQPLFCLVDTAADALIGRLLESASDRRESLRGGVEPTDSPLSGPYLVQIDPDSPLLKGLISEGWGRGWASFFTSTASFEALSGHFGRFYQVQSDAGEVYFHFYNPTVLREFLGVASVSELAAFFGPVEEWLLEDADRSSLLRASNGAGGLLTRQVRGT